MKGICLTGLVLSLLCSCSAPQDIGYLRYQLRHGGNPEQIEQSLLELSEDGYIEAELVLADLYMQSGELEKLHSACTIYKRHKSFSDRAAERYGKCLALLSYQDASVREIAHEVLLKSSQTWDSLLIELARFYSFHTAYYSTDRLWDVVNQIDDDEVGRDIFLRLVSQLDQVGPYREKIVNICTGATSEKTLGRCEQLRLQMALQEDDQEAIETEVAALKEKYKDADLSGGLSQLQESTLYRCCKLLFGSETGSRHLLAALNISALGWKSSERLFLLAAKYEYKRKIIMTTEVLLAGLQRFEQQGSTDAALILGRIYARGYRVDDDPRLAEQYLLKIPQTPKSALYLGRLYLSGKLGAERLQEGVDKVLYAARNGEYLGYQDLAEAFDGLSGIRPNHQYAWVFATVGARNVASPEKAKNLQELADRIGLAMKDQGLPQQLLLDEMEKLRDTELANGVVDNQNLGSK